jgi:hypothetical protein
MIKVRGAQKIVMVLIVIIFMMALGVQGTAFAGDAKGTKLPADGGEPGKDYMAYVKALHAKDGATIRKMVDVGQVSDKELKTQMDTMADMTPSDQKIVSGTINGNTAVLSLTGTLDKEKQYGTIELQKNGGLWKITKEAWSDSPKK